MVQKKKAFKNFSNKLGPVEGVKPVMLLGCVLDSLPWLHLETGQVEGARTGRPELGQA